MPVGILINVFSVFLGGIVGGLVGERISEKFKQEINMVFGACSMAMGIYAIAPMKYMPAVIFSVVLGTGIGLTFHLGEKINQGALLMQRPIAKLIPNEKLTLSEEEFVSTLVTVIVLFCAVERGYTVAWIRG